ncbi:MerR family transcriptional regulator [Kocuria palustris]|uniref:MerR family transcriptional regulator n=1 Tax=Kocuria palustris TaxID=71999 RepID=UPI001F15212E|nr:MerR family transcriptional regulator [Kocuria palustris]
MSTTEQDLTIGPAAAALGVSVRTLRHWDDLGLLRPAGRAASGYRLYSADDVVRGRRILAYRELGFSLDEVTALLHEPAQQTVRRLRERRSAAEAEAFGPDWDPQWTREARDRWGGTDAWTEQAERGARRGPEQWARLAAAPCPAGPDVPDGSVVPGPLRPPGRGSGRLAAAGDRGQSPITGHRPGDRGLGVTVTGPNVVGRRC